MGHAGEEGNRPNWHPVSYMTRMNLCYNGKGLQFGSTPGSAFACTVGDCGQECIDQASAGMSAASFPG